MDIPALYEVLFRPEFLAVNPLGTLPLLVTEDGPIQGIKAIRKYFQTRPDLSDHPIFKGRLAGPNIFPRVPLYVPPVSQVFSWVCLWVDIR